MIHPTAIVSDEAQIADDVEIGAYAVIGAAVEVGPGNRIGPHVVIEGRTRLGCDNRIFQFASIGAEPQDKKHAGEPTRLCIGDRNTIREFCTVNTGTVEGGGETRLGNDNWIMAYVHIAHDCVVGNEVIMANNATLAGHVVIEDHAVMGGFTKAHQFCRVGAYSFCGMGSGLNRDVPTYVTVAGHMAAPKGINTEGLRRSGFSREQIGNIRQAYKVLYRSDLKLADAIERLAELATGQPEIRPLVEFLRGSQRSIIR